jgi:hypothetical protein
LMDDAFIALLKVTVTSVLGHAPLAVLGGIAEITVGRVMLELEVPVLPVPPQPATKTSIRNVAMIRLPFALRMSHAFSSSGVQGATLHVRSRDRGTESRGVVVRNS